MLVQASLRLAGFDPRHWRKSSEMDQFYCPVAGLSYSPALASPAFRHTWTRVACYDSLSVCQTRPGCRANFERRAGGQYRKSLASLGHRTFSTDHFSTLHPKVNLTPPETAIGPHLGPHL